MGLPHLCSLGWLWGCLEVSTLLLSIRFSVNKRIFVVGFGLYGSIHGPTDYQVNIQVPSHLRPAPAISGPTLRLHPMSHPSMSPFPFHPTLLRFHPQMPPIPPLLGSVPCHVS